MIAGAARLADAAYGDEDCEEHPQLRPAGALSYGVRLPGAGCLCVS